MEDVPPPPRQDAVPARTGKRLFVAKGRFWLAFVLPALPTMVLGETHWFLQGFLYGLPAFGWFALLAGFFACLGNARRTAFAAVFLALVFFARMLPLYVPPAHASTQHDPNFRLLVTNVYEKNWQRDAFPAFAEEADVDVVLLQELDRDWHERMLALQETYPHAMRTSRWTGDKMDLGQYGKWEPDSIVLAETLGLPAAATTYRVNGRTVTLLNLHTRSPFTADRARQHRAEFDRLVEWVRKTEGALIVAGDFNSTPWHPLFRRLIKETRLRQARQGYGVSGTWPSFMGFLRTPLDHVFVSPEIDVNDFRVGPAVGSDHRPVLVDLHVRKPENGADGTASS